MTKKEKISYAKMLLKWAVEGVKEKKADGVVSLDLTSIKEAMSDYFVICQANSATQVKAIADSVEEVLFNSLQENPLRKEGMQYGEWVLLDYGEVVIHIFKPEKRNFYALEELWKNAPIERYA